MTQPKYFFNDIFLQIIRDKSNSDLKFSNGVFLDEYIEGTDLKFQFKIPFVNFNKNYIFRFILNFYFLLSINFKNKIKKFDMVIIPHDIADVRTRLFIYLCERLKIKIVILSTWWPSITYTIHKKFDLQIIHHLNNKSRLLSALFNNDYHTGAFAKTKFITSPFNQYANRLIELGINKNRIIKIGHPLYERLKFIDSSLPTDAILFISEMNEIFSDFQTHKNYVYKLMDELNRITNHVYIKLHPRETKIMSYFYRNIAKTFDNVSISNSDYSILGKVTLVIGLNSFMLFEATILNKDIIIYNPSKEKLDSFFGGKYKILMKNDDEKMIDFITNGKNQRRVFLKKWISNTGINLSENHIRNYKNTIKHLI